VEVRYLRAPQTGLLLRASVPGGASVSIERFPAGSTSCEDLVRFGNHYDKPTQSEAVIGASAAKYFEAWPRCRNLVPRAAAYCIAYRGSIYVIASQADGCHVRPSADTVRALKEAVSGIRFLP
jgi:hypothetical protein